MPKLIIGASHSLNCSKAIGTFEADWEQACTQLIPIDGFDGERHHLIYLTPKTRFVDFERAGDEIRAVFSPLIEPARAFDRPDVDVVFLVGGNEHNDLCFCEHPVPWDFDLPGVEHIDPARQILPLSLVEQLLRARLERVIATLAVLSQEFRHAKRHYVCPPPPIPSLEHIARNPEAFDLSRFTVAPAHLRLKVYRVFVAQLEGICRGLGIRFIPAPPEAHDDEGFLAEPYWAGCTHAKPAFYRPLFDRVAEVA